MRDEPKIREAFKSGAGVGWHEHSHDLFEGTERFFRPGYNAHLIGSWIPALDGVEAKLERGARVADVGCGLGASTILMAKAYPEVGSSRASTTTRRRSRPRAGVPGRRRRRPRALRGRAGERLHGHLRPRRACSTACTTWAIRSAPRATSLGVLEPDGTWLIVEPFANDNVEDNLNPVGRVFYGASTLVCTPASLSQEVGLGLGAQAGEARLRDVVTAGGFTRFRRATETPFNLVLEARP